MQHAVCSFDNVQVRLRSRLDLMRNFVVLHQEILLAHETLRKSCRTGAASFSFLGVYEDWQDNYAQHEVTEDFRFATYPFQDLPGALALMDDSEQAMVSLLRRRQRLLG